MEGRMKNGWMPCKVHPPLSIWTVNKFKLGQGCCTIKRFQGVLAKGQKKSKVSPHVPGGQTWFVCPPGHTRG